MPASSSARVEHLAGRADERAAGEILLVARLLADEHDRGVERAFAEHGLRRALVEGAAACSSHRLVRAPRAQAASRHCSPGLGAARRRAIISLSRACAPAISAPNERGLGQVPPIFLRHLLQHRADLEPRRIEDRRIIGPPHLLDRIARRRVGLRRAGPIGQRLAVPVERQLGRQDRPAHVGEAAHEEAGVGADDVMLRLEPGDEARAVAVVDLAEADEGVHLVHVAPHRLGHRLEPARPADRPRRPAAWRSSRSRSSSA